MLLLILIASTVGPSYGQFRVEPKQQTDPSLSPEATKTAGELRGKIREEISKLPDHEWAGEYYEGDGLGENVAFTVAPRAGYVFEWHGCLGLYGRNYGSVTATNGGLTLSFTFTNKDGLGGIAKEFVPIAWGKRRYLVPANDLIGFCNAVNFASEPRKGGRGRYLLRRGDEEKDVTGLPSVPAEYRRYLLKEPIEAEIISVGPFTVRRSAAEWYVKDIQVTLNAGTNRGLLPGMQLFIAKPDLANTNEIDAIWDSMTLKIIKVMDKEAEGVITQDTDRKVSPPKVGWRYSTGPWRDVSQ
jgi:hypothetical protein